MGACRSRRRSWANQILAAAAAAAATAAAPLAAELDAAASSEDSGKPALRFEAAEAVLPLLESQEGSSGSILMPLGGAGDGAAVSIARPPLPP